VAEAISAMGSEEVLEAKMVLAGAMLSHSLRRVFCVYKDLQFEIEKSLLSDKKE
jgi:hypothetical protein